MAPIEENQQTLNEALILWIEDRLEEVSDDNLIDMSIFINKELQRRKLIL